MAVHAQALMHGYSPSKRTFYGDSRHEANDPHFTYPLENPDEEGNSIAKEGNGLLHLGVWVGRGQLEVSHATF